MTIGEKYVFGRDNTVNFYIDIEFGPKTIIADWVYICDFDHVYSDITMPIKNRGIANSPVYIGPDVWVGTKVTVLRGAIVGPGSVLAAHTVARGDIPPLSVVGGIPGRVLKNRWQIYEDAAHLRRVLLDIAAKDAAAAASTPGAASPRS